MARGRHAKIELGVPKEKTPEKTDEEIRRELKEEDIARTRAKSLEDQPSAKNIGRNRSDSISEAIRARRLMAQQEAKRNAALDERKRVELEKSRKDLDRAYEGEDKKAA